MLSSDVMLKHGLWQIPMAPIKTGTGNHDVRSNREPTISVLMVKNAECLTPCYNIGPLLDVAITGQGQTVALIDFATRDVETVHSLVPSATIDHTLGSVISQSFGLGESCAGSAYLQQE